jgi:8-oxo-dGTP diphosphatase
VVRKGARPRVAVVQRGKLKRSEKAIAGARREVIEETGHRVRVREYLGAITYRASGRPKVVQFWRMQAARKPSHDLMADIAAVKWLPLKAAVRRLSYPLEKLFLDNVGRVAIAPRKGRRKQGGKPRAGALKTKRGKGKRKARRKSTAKRL